MTKTYYDSGNGPRIARAALPLGIARDAVIGELEGGVRLLKDGRTSFQDSPRNLALVQSKFPNLDIELPNQAAVNQHKILMPRGNSYLFKTNPFGKYQMDALTLCQNEEYYALFMEQGTGKTWVAINKASAHWMGGEISGVLIIAPNGVHRQWLDQLEQHLGSIHGKPIEYTAKYWDGKINPFSFRHDKSKMEWFCTTFSSLRSKAGKLAVSHFLKRHADELMVVVDESQCIANIGSQQTQNTIDIGQHARYRLILSGTPIPKSPEDEWTQSLFLDESIFGHRYVTTFRREYGIMVKGEVIKWRNLEEFREKMQPHCYRITKADALDLPPKVYDKFRFDLHPEQRKHYLELKRNFLTKVKTGEIVTVQNAAVLLMRLQQIASGTLINEDKTKFDLPNARKQALSDLLQKFANGAEDKILIWCRFRQDILDVVDVCQSIGDGYVCTLHGNMDEAWRNRSVDSWMNDPNAKYLVANPAVGGMGLNLQGECKTVIYYTNSFNSVERWQSEDRVHRIGTKDSILYVDLIANNTIDEKILANLKEKKDLASMLLGDIVQLVEDA